MAKIMPDHYQMTLLRQWLMRDVKGRYRGSMLGFAWPFLLPLMMLAVYSFVFLGVFRLKMDGYVAANLYPVMLYSGLLLHGMLGEILGRSASILLEQRALIKKVVFPLYILPLSVVLSALVHLLGGVVILIAARLALGGWELPLTIAWLPLILLFFTCLCAGIGWMLASLGVYVQDVRQLVGPLTTLLLFLGPVFYPLHMMPEAVQPFAYLNPLTVPIEALRDTLLLGQHPDMLSFAIYAVLSLLVMCVGWWWFSLTKRGFADVL